MGLHFFFFASVGLLIKEKIELKDVYSGKQFNSIAASSFLGLF